MNDITEQKKPSKIKPILILVGVLLVVIILIQLVALGFDWFRLKLDFPFDN